MSQVSVIIPTYNRAKTIGAAIDSVLKQTFRYYEIIVIDDGSTDDTAGKLKQYGKLIKYIHQENKGVSAARNAGLRLATGGYIAFLDSDDTWVPDKLEKQLKYFENNSRVGLLYSSARYLAVNNNTEQIKPRVITRNLREMIEKDAVFPTSTVIIRRECLDKVGMFDETLRGIEDFDLWFRIAERYPIYFQDEITAQHNYYGSSLADQSDEMSRAYIKIYNKIIAKYKDQYNLQYMRERLARQHYSLGIHNMQEKDNGAALQNVTRALAAYPFVGVKFAGENDLFWRPLILVFKPYLTWLYLLTRKIAGKK
jgi:glycosyltransferase involved in cell wall biosynthesis